MSKRVWISAAAAVLTLIASPTDASADSAALEAGRGLWQELDLEEAVRTFEAVLTGAVTTRREAAEAHAYLAAIHQMSAGEMNDLVRYHASAAVALDARVLPPASAATGVRDLFIELRQSRGAAAIALDVRRGGEGEPREVFAVLEPAPPGLVRQVRVSCTDGTEATGTQDGVGFTLGADGDVECSVEALSEGGVVWFSHRQVILEHAPVEGRGWKLGVGIAAGVLALVGAAVAVAITQQDEDTPDGMVSPIAVTWGGLQ